MAEESQTTANDDLVTEALILALLVDRYAIGLQNAAGARLARLRSDIISIIARNDPTAPARLNDRANRLQKVTEESNALVKSAYTELNREIRTALRTLAEIVEESTVRQAGEVVGADIFTRRSEPEELRSLADNAVIMGAILKVWLERHAGDLQFRINTALQNLFVRRQSLGDILDVVRGSENSGGADGVIGLSMRRVAVLLMAAAHAVSNRTRDALFKRHEEMVRGWLHYSRIDERTTDTCRIRHLRRWTLDGEPIDHNVPFLGPAPLHWGCRSIVVPVLLDYNSLPAKIRRQVSPDRFTSEPSRETDEPPRNNQPISAREFRNSV